MTALRVPPGRAGRQRLRRRLAAAERGADLLERKLHSLLDEQRERRRAALASARAWAEAAAEADRWLARALAASGHDGLRQCLPTEAAVVSIQEKLAVGVRFPAQASCDIPAAGYPASSDSTGAAAQGSHREAVAPSGAKPAAATHPWLSPKSYNPTITPDSAALVCAQAAYADAVRAAVNGAVDQAAVRIVDAAVIATRRQVRILRRHWIPTLREALTRLEAVLEQSDFEDGVRRRHLHTTGPTTLVAADTRRDARCAGSEKGGG